MSLRHQVLVDLPDPKYQKYGKEPFVTIVMYHGGKKVHRPKAEYVGGNKMYLVGGGSQTEPQTEFQTEPQIEPIVEPQTETNIQKGKRVVVENEDNSKFDESEWDKVFNIVDSYANDYEQGGVESQNEGEGEEESDRLVESQYEMDVDDDTEQGDQTEHGGFDNVEESGDDSQEGEASDPEEATIESGVEETDDDFVYVVGSDEEDKGPKCVFNPRNKYNPHFEIGMIFSNKVELRDAIHSHVVTTKRSLKIMKNDKRRVYVKCLGDGCQWRLNALKLGGESTFQIREYNSEHKCARSFNVKNVNSKWLSAKYEDAFRTDLKRNVKGFRKDLVMNDGGDGTGHRKFSKFYICFDALRRGFLSGCRPVIGVDGCHLKGPYGGVFLTAVSIDPNNNLYPLAYAVVAGETRESWQWFLELLKGNLHIVRDDTYTFISNKQKGLIPAFECVFPGADNRFCVRHMHNNMKTVGFRGLAFKKSLWNAAKATTVSEFNFRMQELEKLDGKVLEWLSDKPPTHWSSNILEAREKPILTMLEWVREWIMTRLSDLRDRAGKKWQDKKICPKIKKIIEKNMDKAADCIPIKSDDVHYEISCYDGARYMKMGLDRHYM
ncbi:UNVERIFIED_CONTAM: hypothetical protein Slati_0857700 [Sesamum latifolium]|uniref:Uncharacterized protein n=1 Tax=Sesamum latifolium TaxID=2727402 RepID=A0AAW2XMD0_9LAMI